MGMYKTSAINIGVMTPMDIKMVIGIVVQGLDHVFASHVLARVRGITCM